MQDKYSSLDLFLASLRKPEVWQVPLLILAALWGIELGSTWLTRAHSIQADQAGNAVTQPPETRNLPRPPSPEPELPKRAPQSPKPSAQAPSPPASASRKKPSPPKDPRLTVFALGERSLAERFEREWVEILRNSGLRVVGSLGLESLRYRQGSLPDPMDVLTALGREAAELLVLIRLEVLDQRDVKFYGRRDTIYRVVVRIDVFSVMDETGLGSWTHELQFTQRGASSETERGSASLAPDVVRGIRSGWQEYRSRFQP